MKRKTNIVHLHDCKQTPCKTWLERFENGQIDAHKAFKEHGAKYDWLYENTDIDLIGWEIENGVFDWKKHSWAVAMYCPQYFDPDKYNWEEYSWAVAEHCPEYFDPDKFNWEEYSGSVAKYCPDKLDPERYNWQTFSDWVAKYCPDKLDPDKFNWEIDSWAVAVYCPHLLTLKP